MVIIVGRRWEWTVVDGANQKPSYGAVSRRLFMPTRSFTPFSNAKNTLGYKHTAKFTGNGTVVVENCAI